MSPDECAPSKAASVTRSRSDPASRFVIHIFETLNEGRGKPETHVQGGE